MIEFVRKAYASFQSAYLNKKVNYFLKLFARQ